MTAMVVNGGKTIIAGRMKGTTPTQVEPNFVQWGTSSTAEAASQTALQAAAAEARVTGSSSIVTVTQTNDSYQVTGSLTSAVGATIREVGLFDTAGSGSPATGGVMFCRAVHADKALAAGDGINYTIKVSY